MTATLAPAAGWTIEQFETFLASRDEPGWLQEKRREAFDLYQQSLETELDPEEYKRVELRTFQPNRYSLQDADT